MSRTRGAAACAAAALLASCATIPTVQPDGIGPDERRARLEAVTSWRATGSIAVDTDERGFQGRFTWVQRLDELTLEVRPRAAGSLRVSGDPDALVVVTRGETYELTDPETELEELLGWWVPFTSMRAWLVGLPDDEHRVELERNADGTLERLEQRLWNVEYEAYQLAATPAGNVLVPRKITLTHDDLTLVVTVLQWLPEDRAVAP